MVARRKRGTLVHPATLGYEVEAEAKERFDALARHAGVSSAVFFERVVENIELNERGLPVWWPEQPALVDGELPIDTA